ncbi:hypothetical protein GCM10010199_62420 [Dactylosporangium roseum]
MLDDGPVARIEAPGPRPDDFPLWPTTTTVTVASPVPAVATEEAVATDRTAAAEDADATQERETAGLTGAMAVQDRPAGRTDQWPVPAMRVMRHPRPSGGPPPSRKSRRARKPRNPAAGLVSMLLTALLAGFFAWTSAEPFWLDMGHAVRGTATVTSCEGSGVLRRCLATFAATGPGAGEPVDGVSLVGAEKAPGTALEARMVPDGRIAYAGSLSGLRVRWAVGLVLVVLCGLALSWLTGAWRLGGRRTRLAAWSLTTAAPLVLAAGIVLASY